MPTVELAQKPRGGLPWPAIGWWVMAALSIASGLWGLYVSLAYPHLGANYERMFTIPIIAFLHTAGGAIASLIGPFQFHAGLRRRRIALHRTLGQAYLIAVGLSAMAGLYLSPFSQAANSFGIAFIALALAWLYTGWQAYATIRRRDVAAHRRWMIRNFALTYAAVTLRIEMPILVAGGMEPILALNLVGWTCWLPNLLVVEAWMHREAREAAAKPAHMARAPA